MVSQKPRHISENAQSIKIQWKKSEVKVHLVAMTVYHFYNSLDTQKRGKSLSGLGTYIFCWFSFFAFCFSLYLLFASWLSQTKHVYLLLYWDSKKNSMTLCNTALKWQTVSPNLSGTNNFAISILYVIRISSSVKQG